MRPRLVQRHQCRQRTRREGHRIPESPTVSAPSGYSAGGTDKNGSYTIGPVNPAHTPATTRSASSWRTWGPKPNTSSSRSAPLSWGWTSSSRNTSNRRFHLLLHTELRYTREKGPRPVTTGTTRTALLQAVPWQTAVPCRSRRYQCNLTGGHVRNVMGYFSPASTSASCPAGGEHAKTGPRDWQYEFAGDGEIQGQTGWRCCPQCQGLFFAGNNMGVCPTHSDDGSANYILSGDRPASGTWQADWKWCSKCQCLFFQSATNSCAAGGLHNDGGGNYVLPTSAFSGGQPQWRWCYKCQCLFYTGQTFGGCPAGGVHDASKSGEYFLPSVGPRGFPLPGKSTGGGALSARACSSRARASAFARHLVRIVTRVAGTRSPLGRLWTRRGIYVVVVQPLPRSLHAARSMGNFNVPIEGWRRGTANDARQ